MANRLDLRPAAELLGGWPEIQPVCISINAVPALKGLTKLSLNPVIAVWDKIVAVINLSAPA